MREKSLDSVRGFAAVGVVMHHVFLVLEPVYPSLEIVGDWWFPLRYLAIGRPAVILFFLLSGFVLSLSIEGDERFFYPSFVIKRVSRIYLPYVAALALSLCLYLLIGPEPIASQSPWFHYTWDHGVNPSTVMGHLLLLGRETDQTFDNVAWSLVFELRISLIFPILFWFASRTGAWTQVVGTVALFVLCHAFLRLTGAPPTRTYCFDLATAVSTTAYFVVFFLMGTILADHRETIKSLLSQTSGFARGAAWLVAWCLMTRPTDILSGAGSIIIICLAISGSENSFLLKRLPRWLGRVSYSLYLVHLPIIVGAYYLMPERPLVAVSLGVLIALVVSEPFNRGVERPSQMLGRLASKFIEKRYVDHACENLPRSSTV